jgi:glutathione synthase/RimK-type ligase-like ATP-grasp enzyme
VPFAWRASPRPARRAATWPPAAPASRSRFARDREIAEALAPILFKRGLMLVGLDVIGDHLTEINVTSPTCMVEIRQQTGFDAAGAFITAIEHACGVT